VPGKAKAFRTIVNLGVKYGPVAYEAVKHGKEPAKELAQRQLSRFNARKQALAHAAGLTDGSVLAVFEEDRQVWVVFNGDQPVASHPTVTTPLAQLIDGYDLTRRQRPTVDRRPKPGPLKAIRGRR